MIKALIISDSHGQLDNVRQAIKNEGRLDMVIHLGDIIGQDDELRSMCECPVVIVKGNCDFYTDNNIVEVFNLDANKIFATHGHYYSADFGIENLAYAAEERGCNIAMYGHTHVPDISYRGKVTVVNPGSISKPRQLNRKPTYGILKMDKDGKTDISIKYV